MYYLSVSETITKSISEKKIIVNHFLDLISFN